jgi:uncharacterized membrane protein
MKPSKEATKKFVRLYIVLLVFFIALGLLTPVNPYIDKATAISQALLNALLFSIASFLFFLVLYLFIKLIIGLFRKEETLKN